MTARQLIEQVVNSVESLDQIIVVRGVIRENHQKVVGHSYADVQRVVPNGGKDHAVSLVFEMDEANRRTVPV